MRAAPLLRFDPQMYPTHFSSGDPVADRRADYARMLADGGDHAAAVDLMRETLALATGWTAGWYVLGEMRAAAGDGEGAADAWREVLRLDPADRLGASLRLQLAGAATGIDAAPSGFVEALFDQYAPRFDQELVGKLGYRVPELIADAIDAARRGSFAHAVDLGCGTGLMGERLRARASFIEGHDISEGMLRKARGKGIYDQLVRSDLAAFDPGVSRADLVTAADVFIYLGRLERVFAAAAAMLMPGGLFAFSLERHDRDGELALRESRRYAHAPAYVLSALDATGFDLLRMDDAVLRLDRQEPVDGLVVLAERRDAAIAQMPLAEGAGADEQPVAIN